MRIVKIAVVILTGMFVVGCATVSVQHDYDTTADFGAMDSYAWIEVPSKQELDDITIRRAKNAVEEQLALKGFTISEDDPDFTIALHGKIKDKVDVVDWGYSYSRYDRYYGGYGGTRRIETYEYEEGTLLIDFVDADSGNLIWRGSGTGVLDPSASPEKREKNVNDAVAKILAKFPPPK